MSVTLVTRPDQYALTQGGRMLYQFSGAGRYQTAGVKASCELFLAYPVTDGTKLALTWNGQTHTLTFKTSSSAPDEFTAGNGTSAYVDSLLTELKGYYPIREAFTLSRNDPTQLPGIIFTAKQPGPQYDISVNLPVGTPFGFGSTTMGADPIVRTQYSVYAELWLQKVGTSGSDLNTDYERIFTPMIECDAEGIALFDVGNVLHSRLKADWPAWNVPAPLPAQYSQRKYFVCYGEAYGSPIQIGRVKTDQIRWAYLGGADYPHRAGGGFDFLYLRNSTPSDDAALRFGPALRYVRPDEPQFLTFLNSRATQAGVKLKITRTFDNNATDDRTASLDAQDFASGQKITYPTGPTQQDLINTVPSGRILKEYAVQLVSSGGAPLSLVYRYLLNYDYQPYTRYFVYLNSLGAAETLTTFGKGSAELNRFYAQAERYLPANYELADGQFVDYNLSTQQQVEVATGFRSQAELRSWNDFYRSSQRFHLAGGKPLPIGITSKSIKQAKDGDTLFAHKFEFVYLFQDAFYTDATGEIGNTLPPLGFAPAGSVTIEQPSILHAVDDTVPSIVRTLTASLINAYNQAVAWGNHALAGYLTQNSGNALYRRADLPVDYDDLSDTPTTRDGYGLTDVPTKTEVAQANVAGLRSAAPDVDDSVSTATSLIVYQTKTDAATGKDYRQSASMNFNTAADFVFANATAEQLDHLLGRLKPTLDNTLTNGNESDREEIVRESNRRRLTLLPALDVLGGRVYDAASGKHLERYISPLDLALVLQQLFDMPTLAAAIAPYLGVEAQAPAATAWIIGDEPLTCEDRWKEFNRDEFDNTDFQ